MRYKLVCFDLDGTIVDDTVFIWETIHQHLKTDGKRRDEAKRKYFNGDITYEQWADHDIKLWKEKKATKKEVIRAIKPLRLMKGAKETIKILKRKKLKLAIISGSLNIVLEKLLPDYKKYFDYVLINKIIFDKKGNILRTKVTKYDGVRKALGLKNIAKKEKIKLKECVFVGDHNNDVAIAKEAGLSISFNSKSKKLDKVCDKVIRKKDLREILKYVV